MGGGNGNTRPRNSTKKPSAINQRWIRGHTGHASMAYSKEKLYQLKARKSEDLFERNTHYRENIYYFRNFQATFVLKTV